MASLLFRSKSFFWVLPLVLIAVTGTPAGAQGMFGASLPQLPFLGGYSRGGSGCGEQAGTGLAVTTFYVGAGLSESQSLRFSAETQGIALLGATKLQHSYANSGLWLGVAETVNLSPSLGVCGSGWYFFQSGISNSPEKYNDSDVVGRIWDVDPRWWFLDGLVALKYSPAFSVLGGVRYDNYTARFTNPADPVGVTSSINDRADLIVSTWIPLIGAQYENYGAWGSFVFRLIGFPVLAGNVKYLEPFNGANALEASGSYKKSYFMEVFTEYAWKFELGQLGLFGRWNVTHVESTLNTDSRAGGATLATENYDFSLNRTHWTLGGTAGLAFNLPY